MLCCRHPLLDNLLVERMDEAVATRHEQGDKRRKQASIDATEAARSVLNVGTPPAS